MSNKVNTHDAAFTGQLLACQDDLYAYLFSLTLDADAAEDLLQQTNLVLCKKAAEAAAAPCFRAWAFKAAHLEVLAHRRDASRRRAMPLDEQVLGVLADEGLADESAQLRPSALAECLKILPASQRSLILRRYQPGGVVKTIAAELGRSVDTVSNLLYRIRKALWECVRRRLAQESRS